MKTFPFLGTVFFSLLFHVSLRAASADFIYEGVNYRIKNDTAEVSVNRWDLEGDIVIPSKVEYEGKEYVVGKILPRAFYYCFFLNSITLPNSLTKIGDKAFVGCSSLNSITIPNSVTFIDKNVFSRCSNLESITVDEENSIYDSRNDCNAIMETATNTLITGCAKTIIPQETECIGEDAFAYNSIIDSIYIPAKVTVIELNAFRSCNNLKRIIVDSENPVYDSRENCNALIETATNTFITGCGNSFVPDGIESIDGYAFENTPIDSLFIPKSVRKIGFGVTADCSNLVSIEVDPENSTYLSDGNTIIKKGGDGALIAGCNTTVIPDYVEKIDVYSIVAPGLKSLVIPQSVRMIGTVAIMGYYMKEIQFVSKEAPQLKNMAFNSIIYPLNFYVPVSSEGYKEQLKIAYPNDDIDKGFIVREYAKSCGELSTSQVYVLKDYKTRDCLVYDAEKGQLCTLPLDSTYSESLAEHSWQVIDQGEGVCLYNLGANKYLTADEENGYALSDTPVTLSLNDDADGVSIEGGSTFIFVYNNVLEPKNPTTGIEDLSQSCSSSSTSYSLNGCLTKNSQGIIVMDGKIVMVK